MKNKLIYIGLFAIMLLSYRCGNEFLDDVENTQSLTDEAFEEAASFNPDLVASTLSGIYTQMVQTGTGGTTGHDDFGQKGYDIMSDFLSADMALQVSTYGWYRTITELQTTQDFTFGDNRQVWRYYYSIVRSANIVIAALGGNDVVPEKEESKYIMGQAKALRAYAYFYLTQFYTDRYDPAQPVLPIYVEAGSVNVGKSTTTEVFDLIIKDLDESISLLNGFTRSAKNEINQDVARALLAYTYGYMGGNDNNAKVVTLTNSIIASGYPIMSSTEVVGGFTDVNTAGWIWGIDITLDLGLDLVSWWGQMDIFTYSYAWAGDRKTIDANLFAQIPANDIRKTQFLNNPASGYHLSPINKFYHSARRIGGQRNVETDYVYMRSAEIYLLNAEANAKLGNDGAARTSLKAVVSKRVPDASYIDGLSGVALQNEIYLQTRIEMWGEGKSYLALKRNRASINRGPNHLSFVGVVIPFDDNRLTFEIPQDEIQNNPFISDQN